MKSHQLSERRITDILQSFVLKGTVSGLLIEGGGYSEDGRMFTLNTVEKHAVCYGISSYFSNAMLSDNPHSGIYETETTRTLDLNCCNQACNQGGVVVMYEVQNDSDMLRS